MLVQNKFAVGKARALGLPTANVSCFLSTEDLPSCSLSVVFTSRLSCITHGKNCGFWWQFGGADINCFAKVNKNVLSSCTLRNN